MRVTVPEVLAVNESIKGNSIEQLAVRSAELEGTIATYSSPDLNGFVFQPTRGNENILIIPLKSRRVPDGYARILSTAVDPSTPKVDCSSGIWLKHPIRGRSGAIDYSQVSQQILESWRNAFSYVEEDPARNVIGLRNPQIGAVHAAHAHWSVSSGTSAEAVCSLKESCFNSTSDSGSESARACSAMRVTKKLTASATATSVFDLHVKKYTPSVRQKFPTATRDRWRRQAIACFEEALSVMGIYRQLWILGLKCQPDATPIEAGSSPTAAHVPSGSVCTRLFLPAGCASV